MAWGLMCYIVPSYYEHPYPHPSYRLNMFGILIIYEYIFKKIFFQLWFHYWFLSLLAYQPSWVIWCHIYSCRKIVVVLFNSINQNGVVSWGCRINRLHLFRGVRPPGPMSVLIYDTKQSDGDAPVMLELWGIQSTPLLLLLPGPPWPEMLAPDWVLSMGQIELNCLLMHWIVWNRTVLTFKPAYLY